MHITAAGNQFVGEFEGDTRFDYVSKVQLDVLDRYKRKLKSKLNVTSNLEFFTSLDEIFDHCYNNDADIYLIRPPWPTHPDVLFDKLANLKSNRPNSKIVLIDPFDQTGSRFFNCLETVDVMLKYQSVKDKQSYLTPMLGGHSYSDYYARELGCNTDHGSVISEPKIDQVHKIRAGWSAAELAYLKRNLLKSQVRNLFPNPKKDIAVICRMRIGQEHIGSYYERNRSLAVDQLETLRPKYKLASNMEIIGDDSTESIPRKQYLDEFKRSKIAVCTFGWGEQTLREFEAVFNNALIIKPDMSHVDIFPDLYQPNVTYVPVKWDYSDLAEKCEYYLNNEDERLKIVKNARKYCNDYFYNNRFLDKFSEVLEFLDAS